MGAPVGHRIELDTVRELHASFGGVELAAELFEVAGGLRAVEGRVGRVEGVELEGGDRLDVFFVGGGGDRGV